MKILLILLGVILSAFVVIQVFAFKSSNNIETYPYVVNKKFKSFEIRTYDAALFTSVKLSSNKYKDESGKGFSILAGYIFGKNEKSQKIAMTSPVSMSLEDSMTMMFMVPKNFNKETLPKPKNSQIKFKQVPKKTVAAISFGGWANDKKIEKYKQKLITALKTEGIPHTNKFYFFGYNPPYEVFNRRNEIIVELEK
ncbi:MAG: soul heme-binding protein [Crocinitomicaceae bacterium]|nr:soul heme-binding protein [Crocinitomicaceae bacterium]